MKLSGFVDFYLMEALKVCMNGDSKPFLHSHARLASDIDYTSGMIANNMANMLADYLWLAAMGEARWASQSATFYTPSLPHTASRSRAYQKFTVFPPSEANIKVLEDIFFERWYSSSYGGMAWGNIARCARLYKAVPHNVFVDTVASIRHNGGLAFNKSESSQVMDINFDIGASGISKLLEVKMRAQRPIDLFLELNFGIYHLMSHVTYRLIKRFVTLDIDHSVSVPLLDMVKCVEPNATDSYLDNMQYTPIAWGDTTMQPVEKVAGRRSYADDNVPCQLCHAPTNIDFLYSYHGKMLCKKCIGKLGLIKCQYCGVYESSNVGRVCGCGKMHCNNCHRTCEMCGGNCCACCERLCYNCHFAGCVSCYRINHSNLCNYCGDTICEQSNGLQGKMTCGQYVCAEHYKRHMERCTECNPRICIDCGEKTNYKCDHCAKFCCGDCMASCYGCSKVVCRVCYAATYNQCTACNRDYCNSCAPYMMHKITCGGDKVCNECYIAHHNACPQCSMSELCSYNGCTNDATYCACGKAGKCTGHHFMCPVCKKDICSTCKTLCYNCGVYAHSSCVVETKCGVKCCDAGCVKSHMSKCKAALQVCSCGKKFEHTGLLGKCSKCNSNICHTCRQVCIECNAEMCSACFMPVYTNCKVLACGKECADKHNATCALAKNNKNYNKIPDFFEISDNILEASTTDDVAEDGEETIEVALDVIEVSATDDCWDTIPTVTLATKYITAAKYVDLVKKGLSNV